MDDSIEGSDVDEGATPSSGKKTRPMRVAPLKIKIGKKKRKRKGSSVRYSFVK